MKNFRNIFWGLVLCLNATILPAQEEEQYGVVFAKIDSSIKAQVALWTTDEMQKAKMGGDTFSQDTIPYFDMKINGVDTKDIKMLLPSKDTKSPNIEFQIESSGKYWKSQLHKNKEEF